MKNVLGYALLITAVLCMGAGLHQTIQHIIVDSGNVVVDSGAINATIVSPLESNGAMPVNIQDQHTPAFDLYFAQGSGVPTTIASTVAIGDTDIDVVTDAATPAGTFVGIFNDAADRFFLAEVLAAVDDTITVDTPADFAFLIGDAVVPTSREMNVSGSLTSPEIFTVHGTENGLDVTRVIFTMILTGTPDDGLFGNISKLTNGLVIRVINGDTRNITNVKTNGELAGISYDVEYTERTVPAGSHGLRCRYTFAGQDKHGVTIRLLEDDELQIFIQDDLTALTQFRVVAAGHAITD